MVRDPIVTRFTKVGGGVTAHSHVRLKFRCLGNRSALTLKSHQKQTYLFRSRSFIAKHGVLLVVGNPEGWEADARVMLRRKQTFPVERQRLRSSRNTYNPSQRAKERGMRLAETPFRSEKGRSPALVSSNLLFSSTRHPYVIRYKASTT